MARARPAAGPANRRAALVGPGRTCVRYCELALSPWTLVRRRVFVPRRVTPSQLKSMIRQAEQKQKQAINKYNSAVRSWNRDVERAINNYNREVRAHNSRVRADRQRLRSELAKLASQGSRSRTQYVSYSASVQTLHQAFVRVEERVESGAWGPPGEALLDITESETANSVEVLNALLADPAETTADLSDLRETSLIHSTFAVHSPAAAHAAWTSRISVGVGWRG